jgi:hypothetical protein
MQAATQQGAGSGVIERQQPGSNPGVLPPFCGLPLG